MEKFEFAIQVLVIGFAVVLFTLFLLYGLLLLFSAVFHKNKEQQSTSGPTAKPLAAGTPSHSTLDFEAKRRIAAVMAAVYQYMQDQQLSFKPGSLRIIPVQPQSSGNGWQAAGRRMLLQNRMELETIRRKKQRENI